MGNTSDYLATAAAQSEPEILDQEMTPSDIVPRSRSVACFSDGLRHRLQSDHDRGRVENQTRHGGAHADRVADLRSVQCRRGFSCLRRCGERIPDATQGPHTVEMRSAAVIWKNVKTFID